MNRGVSETSPSGCGTAARAPPTYHFLAQEHGPARVARVDGRIDLHGQQRRAPIYIYLYIHPRERTCIDEAVKAPAQLDASLFEALRRVPGDDAAGNRDVVAASRVANAGDGLLELRHLAELEGGVVGPEGLVVHLQHGDVALVPDAHHTGHEPLWVAVAPHPTHAQPQAEEEVAVKKQSFVFEQRRRLTYMTVMASSTTWALVRMR